jgi:hypothetical protein
VPGCGQGRGRVGCQCVLCCAAAWAPRRAAWGCAKQEGPCRWGQSGGTAVKYHGSSGCWQQSVLWSEAQLGRTLLSAGRCKDGWVAHVLAHAAVSAVVTVCCMCTCRQPWLLLAEQPGHWGILCHERAQVGNDMPEAELLAASRLSLPQCLSALVARLGFTLCRHASWRAQRLRPTG